MTQAERPEQVRIEREVSIAASPEAVWRAWTDPDGLAAWFVDRASGEPRVGEEMTWVWEKFGFEGHARVLEAVAPERFVLELLGTPGGSRVLEIDIRGESGGTTRLRVVESGFAPDDPSLADTDSGWSMALGVLRIALERYPAEARRDLMIFEPARPDASSPRAVYATMDGLAEWFCDGTAGTLVVPGAGAFDGERTVLTPTEALWTWPARRAAVEMKSFDMGAGPMVGLRVSAWGPAADDLAGLEPALRAAVQRLVGTLAATM